MAVFGPLREHDGIDANQLSIQGLFQVLDELHSERIIVATRDGMKTLLIGEELWVVVELGDKFQVVVTLHGDVCPHVV